MIRCREIYRSDRPLEDRRNAIELLRVVADRRVVPWISDFLNDADDDIQSWGAGIIDQLLFSDLVEVQEVEHLLEECERHPNSQVRETIKSVRSHLKNQEEYFRTMYTPGTDELLKDSVTVLGKRMTFTEMGKGDPIVFLHGNPTSSYLWRNILPRLVPYGRCIAPDLIGMGDSQKLDNPGPQSYRFVEHRRYLDALLQELGVESNVTLVVHDWGSALGFDWARRHPDAVKGIAYMEGIVRPVSWDDWPDVIKPLFEAFRSEAGESMVLQKNVFVEKVLPGSVLRGLSDTEMEVYRRPFAEPGEDRRPTLTWPRQIPLSGEPEDVVQIVSDYAEWMSENDLPKLFINAEPGAILVGPQREFCRSWTNQTEVTVAGSHFIQEDSPEEIAQAIKTWLQEL